MTIHLTLSPDTEQRLRELATRAGQTVEGFVRQIVEREVQGANGSQVTDAAAPHSGQTFDEILAPIRQEFAESGMTEEELDRLFEEAREEVWRERQQRKDQS